MYRHILVAVEHSAADRTILRHVEGLAKLTGARLLLVHVADGWAARNFERFNLRESEEMIADRRYLEELTAQLREAGLAVEMRLEMGDPAEQILRVAEAEQVDLIAMSTHGHRFIADLVHGTTVDRVRHKVGIPVLLLKAHEA